MNLDEIIDRERKRSFGFSDDRQCLFTFGDFRRLLMEIEDAAKRERDNTIYAGRNGEMTLDECITRCDNNSGDNPRGRDVALIGCWLRELRELRERRNAPANAAAMREALEEVQIGFDNNVIGPIGDRPNDWEIDEAKRLRDVVDSALSAPARNCDVGTADEQAERFDAECKRHDHCTPCPVHAAWGEFKEGKPKSCQIIWAQMPFAKAEGGAE